MSTVGTAAHMVVIGELDLSCSKRFKESLAESAVGGPEDDRRTDRGFLLRFP